MTGRFRVYGPFTFDKKLMSESDHQKYKWDEIEHEYPHLSNAMGVYLFSLRNNQNYKPVYVGKTSKQGFRKGDFQQLKFSKISYESKKNERK